MRTCDLLRFISYGLLERREKDVRANIWTKNFQTDHNNKNI